MSRSKWKRNFVCKFLLKKCIKSIKNTKIWSRQSSIPAKLVGSCVFIHNGKEFRKVFINKDKVGFKFGEFAFTRKYNKKIKKGKVSLVKSKKK